MLNSEAWVFPLTPFDQNNPWGLTPREWEFLNYTARVRTTRDISAELSVSQSNVESSLARARSKMNVGTTNMAVASWVSHVCALPELLPAEVDEVLANVFREDFLTTRSYEQAVATALTHALTVKCRLRRGLPLNTVSQQPKLSVAA